MMGHYGKTTAVTEHTLAAAVGDAAADVAIVATDMPVAAAGVAAVTVEMPEAILGELPVSRSLVPVALRKEISR